MSDETPLKFSPVQLLVVGTGIQWGGQTTLAAQRAISGADKVFFAVTDPWAARWIRTLNTTAESFAYPRDGRPRRQIYRAMVQRVLSALAEKQRVCAVFYGSPGVLTWPAHAAVREARRQGFAARMLPGVSSLDCLFADLAVDPGEGGCQIYESGEFLRRGVQCDPHSHLILCQVAMIGNGGPFDARDGDGIRRGLGELREQLRATFPPGHPVVVYDAASRPTSSHRAQTLSLRALPEATIRETSTVYVPPLARSRTHTKQPRAYHQAPHEFPGIPE